MSKKILTLEEKEALLKKVRKANKQKIKKTKEEIAILKTE